MADVKEGYINDYISGVEVRATPEEVEAVQVFSRQLVEDYDYSPHQIQTRPQFRVKARPSDRKKEYPVDIAVFQSDSKSDNNLYIVVECKKKNRKDGRDQLEDYLRLSRAELGVWFNGNERLFIRKVESNGKILFEEIPNIPKAGQRVEDVGKFRREDLQTTHNLKATFKAIRNHLAANTVGATRDEVLAQQIIDLIFCKIYDEKFTRPDEMVTFRAGVDESLEVVAERIYGLFRKVKERFSDVIDTSEIISLDQRSIYYVVGELQNYALGDAERDVIADAFETFIGHALKGGQGQFFTPRNVVQMMVEMVQPTAEDAIIDPACGSGGFLIESLRHVWSQVEAKGKGLGWSLVDVEQEKQRVATNNFRGIDKDYFLSKVTKAYMAVVGDGKGGIFCEDSLETIEEWQPKTRDKISLNQFDIVLTNPPFGSKIPVKGREKLAQYELGHKWKRLKGTEDWEKKSLKESEAPQILFIERCLDLLKEDGRMAIVLPDGIFGNDKFGYIRNYILNKARILAIVDVPIETFMPNTSTKTSILVLQKKQWDKPEDYQIFMAIAEECGHDRRGKETPEDDIQKIAGLFKEWCKENNIEF